MAGTLPSGLSSLGNYARLATPVAGDVSREVFRLALAWTDWANGDHEGIDVTLALTAVDRAGNESSPSAPIRVRHLGEKPGR